MINCGTIGVYHEIDKESIYLKKLFENNISNIFNSLKYVRHVEVNILFDKILIKLYLNCCCIIEKSIYLDEYNDVDDIEFSGYNIILNVNNDEFTISKLNDIQETFKNFANLLNENIQLIINYGKTCCLIFDNQTDHIRAYDDYYYNYYQENFGLLSKKEIERNIKLDIICQTIINS